MKTIQSTLGTASVFYANQDDPLKTWWSKLNRNANRPLSWYRCSTKVWPNTKTKHTTGKSQPKLVSGPVGRLIHQSSAKRRHFGNLNFCKVMYGERASLARQFVCHTKPYKNYNFQIDGASRYFGLWLRKLVHALILVCSSSVSFLCLATKHYRSCSVRDKSLLGSLFSSARPVDLYCV